MALDFMRVYTRTSKRGSVIEIYPKFIITKTTDLMIRGGDFYAIWVEERGLWSTDEFDAFYLIDRELDNYAKENKDRWDCDVRVLHMWDAENGMIDRWNKYCHNQMPDDFHMLDEKLIFSNTETRKQDYASKKLPYPLESGEPKAWNRILSVLYSDEERHKIEWAIGSIVHGDSKSLQKFMVFYGSAGTGKSTVMNIIEKLFEGYTGTFDAKALGSSNNAFALESFRNNPLVAIQQDGDLSRIEDNTRLNSLVSHETMMVNEKFKTTYANSFKSFLFMGTNKPVKITDAKSGLIRRLIDVSPTGEKIPPKEYRVLTKQVLFELGMIASRCQDIYLADKDKYDDYIPIRMLGATNDFYNFVMDSWHVFRRDDETTLKAAWEMYKTYCEDAKVLYPYSRKAFGEELKNYFREYSERINRPDGTRVRNHYSGFRTEKFEPEQQPADDIPDENHWLKLDYWDKCIFDLANPGCLAQYANDSGTPTRKWIEVQTRLQDIDTKKLHYVKVAENHIVIDFDICDKDGNKLFESNLEEASKWPPTYAEVSKSGKGIHLHYIYSGDPSELSRVYDDKIEVKVFTGNSSLRRMLTRCNNLPIATISSGLPKKEKKMVNFDRIKSEKGLRMAIKRNLNKEIHDATKPSVDFIYKILDDAYNSDLIYDVSDMHSAILSFAAGSTNQAETCIKTVAKMKFKSKQAPEAEADTNENTDIVFYDVEVFPNLFLINWKLRGEGKPVIRMINPSSQEVEALMRYRLIGFNCRRYDNHILYARLMGYSNEQLFKLSQKIVSGESRDCFFGEAYNISYTDVYDFSAKKQSLKKFEIELGLHHQELGLPWDQPVPEERWVEVAEYCDNDVIATEAVFNARRGDFVARQIQARLAGGTVNDTTNSLSAKIVFGNNRKPQDQFNYRDMGDVSVPHDSWMSTSKGVFFADFGDEYTTFDDYGRPIFPGYTFDKGKSIYRGEEVGEGGYVYAEPGMYGNVALLDVASMHPSSIIAEELFGPVYTKRFKELKDARLAIKHRNFDTARKMLDGALVEYIDELESGTAWFTADDLAQALKIVINSIYGLTAAKFDNPFRDPRNKDNIVAKRGALFMINLKHEVQKRGFVVAHVKTDSIKIPDATPEIIQFVMDYGEQYGYTFEHEATYDRMCLVNDAVYIARYPDGKWTATGTQFAVPYVFKTLFSREPITFDDMCETKSVSSAFVLDMNEGYPNVSAYEAEQLIRDKIRDNPDDISLMKKINPDFLSLSDEQLQAEIDKGHNYIFVGKVGHFCPVKAGCGGGILYRRSENAKTGRMGYAAAGGSKGYRWLESEMVRLLGKEADIDRRYYDKLVDAAVETISRYGDFEWFISN